MDSRLESHRSEGTFTVQGPPTRPPTGHRDTVTVGTETPNFMYRLARTGRSPSRRLRRPGVVPEQAERHGTHSEKAHRTSLVLSGPVPKTRVLTILTPVPLTEGDVRRDTTNQTPITHPSDVRRVPRWCRYEPLAYGSPVAGETIRTPPPLGHLSVLPYLRRTDGSSDLPRGRISRSGVTRTTTGGVSPVTGKRNTGHPCPATPTK